MARPRRCRRICTEPAYDHFGPEGISAGEQVILTLDEYEALRLIDLEKLTHAQCGQQMDVSRTTVTELYESARYKVADSIVHGKPLVISGGSYRLCPGGAAQCSRGSCRKRPSPGERPEEKGENVMRIAVTYENGQIFQHFGHTQQFKLYDVENGQVVNTQVVGTDGQGHGALGGFLAAAQVDALICGGIGGGAQNALAAAGIQLFGGVSGPADAAVQAYLAGSLGYDPNVQCDHHGHHHGEGHTCGSHDHSCGGHTCGH